MYGQVSPRNKILIFEEHFTAKRYLHFLSLELVPAVNVIFPNKVDPNKHFAFNFQNDSAAAYFVINLREYLDKIFTGHWNLPCGTIEWSPEFPDLTQLDYFLWRYLTDKIYQNRLFNN